MKYNLPVILGRNENENLTRTLDSQGAIDFYNGKNVLITGSEGSLGEVLQEKLRSYGANVWTVDLEPGADFQEDITSTFAMRWILDVLGRECEGDVDYIFHLAADKHAPHAETAPAKTVKTNIDGVLRVMKTFPKAHFVLASTCKAADPEVVYGATKMVAERIVLDEGGSVARFYNVPETQGNVFEIWEESGHSIDVMDCQRYFISKQEAIALLVAVPQIPAGRYTVDGVAQRRILDLAGALHPDKTINIVSPRRGDRVVEPLHAKSEYLQPYYAGIAKVVSIHDKPV